MQKKRFDSKEASPVKTPSMAESSTATDTTDNSDLLTLQSIMAELSLIENDIHMMKQTQQEIQKAISFLSDSYEDMKHEMKVLLDSNNRLRRENDMLCNRLGVLESEVTELDQYHRLVNVEVCGIPEAPNGEENTKAIIISVL